jgi:hypothetical protein
MNWWAVLEIVVGALISIGFIMWMENLRKPRLNVKIVPPVDATYVNRPAGRARFLGLSIENEKLPRFAGWLSRNAAIHCYAIVSFYHMDGQNIFGRSMQARWSGSQEPVAVRVGQQMVSMTRFELHTDIHPGDSEKLDVAARFDSDVECYGWCNDSYFSNPPWRNPDWKLDHGCYLVKVTVISLGESYNGLFRLINDVPVSDFRLEKALTTDTIVEY